MFLLVANFITTWPSLINSKKFSIYILISWYWTTEFFIFVSKSARLPLIIIFVTFLLIKLIMKLRIPYDFLCSFCSLAIYSRTSQCKYPLLAITHFLNFSMPIVVHQHQMLNTLDRLYQFFCGWIQRGEYLMIGLKSQVSFTLNFDTCYLNMTYKIFYIRSAFHVFHKHVLSFHVSKIPLQGCGKCLQYKMRFFLPESLTNTD